jgi:hypothetical protein
MSASGKSLMIGDAVKDGENESWPEVLGKHRADLLRTNTIDAVWVGRPAA